MDSVKESEQMGVVEALKRSEVFLGLDDSELIEIANLPSTKEESWQPNQFIFRKGERAKLLYVLKEGKVNLVTERKDGSSIEPERLVVDDITKGEAFGWSALVAPRSYVLSAFCSEPSKVIAISGEELAALFERNNHIGYKVLYSVTLIIFTRLRYTEQLVVQSKRWPLI